MLKKLISCLALVALSSSVATAGVSVRKVFSTKERMLTPSDRPRLGSFGSPAVNDFGEVAVVTTLFGPLTFNNTSLGILFGKKVRTSVLVARRGNYPAPEILFWTANLTFPAPVIRELDDYTILNNKRDVMFSGEVRGAVKTGPLAPVLEIIGQYIGLANPAFPVPRLVAFGAEGDEVDFFVQPQFAFHEINKEGALNKKGSVSFIARSTNDNPGGEWDGIWFGRTAASTPGAPNPGGAGAILTVGEVVHGLPFNSDYSSFGGVAIDPQGKVFTIATITNKGAGFYGIWSGRNSFMAPVVTRLTRKPDNPDLRFGSFTTPITVSRKGKALAFLADNSIWLKKGKKLTEAAKARDIVGTESRVDTQNEKISGFESGAAVNSKGRIAFLARTTTGSVTTVALVASTGDRKFVAIARVGDLMRVNGRAKEIINLELNTRAGLSETGVVAFTASFLDRTSAVFLARVK